MATRQSMNVAALPLALTDALGRLVKKDVAQRGFVIVDHDSTGRFFQYCTALSSRQLLYDVPQLGIVTQPCTLTEGVESGMALVERWGLADDELVTLTEDDSESGRRRLTRKAKEWLERLREKLTAPLPALPEAT